MVEEAKTAGLGRTIASLLATANSILWLELRHLRERVTNADRVIEDEIREMLIAPPRIEFLVSAGRGNETRHRRAEAAGV
jgi:hypothetical protein